MRKLKRILSIAAVLILLSILVSTGAEGKETVVDQSFRIGPEEHKVWEFESSGFTRLYIFATSDLYTFSLYLIEEDELDDLEMGEDFDYEYQASTVFEADLVWDVPGGIYYLVALNEFENVSVNLEIRIEKDDAFGQGCCGGVLIASSIAAASLVGLIIVIKRKR